MPPMGRWPSLPAPTPSPIHWRSAPTRVRKVAVVGGPGSGKSTLAREIARSIGAPHIELDALWWGPGWKPIPLETFQRAVTDAVASDAWVADGNYIDEV